MLYMGRRDLIPRPVRFNSSSLTNRPLAFHWHIRPIFLFYKLRLLPMHAVWRGRRWAHISRQLINSFFYAGTWILQEGKNFHFIRNWQILYGFYTSRCHESNGVVCFSIIVLHFLVIFRMHVEPWFQQKQGAEPWALKFSHGGKILPCQNIVKFILVFHGFL